MTAVPRPRAVHYAWIVPLEQAFGWSRDQISSAVAINLVLYGLIGPFAAAVMDRVGVRRTLAVEV